MINRRSFLWGTATLALSQLLSACQTSQQKLQLLLLQGSFPPQLLSQVPYLQIDQRLQLKELFEQITQEKANLVIIGDHWLTQAVAEGKLEPILEQDFPPLTDNWKELVKRNATGKVDPQGEIWAIPYRWGATIIAYREDKFEKLGWIPRDWSDLWKEDLKGKFSLLNQPREVIGLTLKKLGHSYNTPNPQAIPELAQELNSLHRQVKFYDSQRYLEPLLMEDTWAAVGWSTDILPIIRPGSKIKAVVPEAGTAMWADLWVKPRQTPSDEKTALMRQWWEFCQQFPTAIALSRFTNALSPLIFNYDRQDFPEDLQNNPLIQARETLLKKSEFLLPLEKEAEGQYQALWTKLAQQSLE